MSCVGALLAGFAVMPAAKATAPLITAPLTGTVTKGTWQYGDLPFSGMSGGKMHYAYLLPSGYSVANSYPTLVYEHENTEGNSWYQNGGDPTINTIVNQNVIDGAFNTVAFRKNYPSIIIVPYCDQTDGSGGASGQNFGGYNDSGATNVNENAVVAVVRSIQANFSAYPAKCYITGDSLGGIGTEASMLDFNAVNGPLGLVFTAGLPFAGQIALRNPNPATDGPTIARMVNVPMFMVSGQGDTTSPPENFNRPLWRAIAGNSNYPAPLGAEAGTSQLYYFEDPALGHDVWDTYRQLAADGGHGDSLYTWLYAKTSPGVVTTLPLQINAAGPNASPFIADTDFTGGSAATNWTGTIDTSAVSGAAPQAVYQSERYGASTYTVPGLTANTNYTVRLHFCENYFTASGQRTFNVSINSVSKLSNFDILATTGAAHKANIQQYTIAANGSGQIIIALTNVVNNALINGVEVLASVAIPATPTGLMATSSNAQVSLSWNSSTGATSYNVKRSTVSGSGYATIASPASTNYVNTGLTNGATYYYVVSAVNSAGESGNSSQASATPSNSGIHFVQDASNDPVSATTIAVTYPSAQTSGNLNIVVVGWNDLTGTVSSVTDSAGNTYTRAIGPTVGSGQQQSIYYASNIHAGSNTVTVTMSFAADYPDIRVLEYSGVSTVDKTAGASGNSATSNSGAATTTSANELIFSANTCYPSTNAPGSGFTTRLISADGDIAEDQIVSSTGSYSGTATLANSNFWVAQMVTFSAGGGSAPPAPTGLTAIPGNAQAALAWNSSTGATSYNVLRSTVSGSGYAQVVNQAGTSYTNTGLTNGTQYYFVVQAVSGGGTSGNSNQAAAKPVLAPAFVQVNSNDPVSAASIAVAYSSAQTAGNLNIVVVGWNDTTSTVSSVVDSLGNTYTLAIGPTTGGGQRQSIYYAKNIKGGSNTVTVTMSGTVNYPDIRVSEYTGVSALDVTAGASGTSTAPNSGSATTTTARELIFSANTCYPSTTAPGSGFTTRVTTVDGDITEDKAVTATGSNSGSATLGSSNFWVMQMATFK